MKKTLPISIGFIVSLIWFGEFFFYGNFYDNWKIFFTDGMKVMLIFGVIVGVYSVFRVNYSKIRYNRDRWYSVVQVLMIFIMIGLALLRGTKAESPFDASFLYAYIPLNATVFSLLAFYISSAAFRSFRAKNLESTLLLIAASIAMMGKIPLGEQISPYIPNFAEWITDSFVSAGRRAIMFGAYLGSLTLFIRIFFGLERSHISSK